MRLIDHRLVVVLGKGGVGRTTVSAALAIAAAEAGKRVVVAELGGAALPPLFGMSGRSYAYRAARPGVDVWSLTVPESLEAVQLPLRSKRSSSSPSVKCPFTTSSLPNSYRNSPSP